MDKVYLNENNIIYLDCTRLEGSNELVSRINPNDTNSVINQIKNISIYLNSIGTKEIVLVDDVVFSGNVLNSVINIFKQYNIEVIGIRCPISMEEAYEQFSKLKLGIKCEYLMSNDVIDEICERDFYFGIACSGISIRKNNTIYKAPYFMPFGDPVERASVPKECAKEFSLSCIRRSIMLWEEIERLTGREIYMSELPEVINNTDSDRVVKVLKKEYR